MRSRLFAAAAASLLLATSACSDSSGPKVGPPARIEITTQPTATGAVKASVGALAVKVSDEGGQGVSGATVSFSASGGGGIAFTPSSATTDETGTARTTVVLGTLAGSATIRAAVTGVATAASTSITTTAGALSRVVSTPDAIRLQSVGDTARISSLLQDVYANVVGATQLAYTVADPALVSVSATGLVTALKAAGTTEVVVSSTGVADTVAVTVLAPGASPCTGVTAPTQLAIGGMTTVAGSTLCVRAPLAAEYTVVAYNKSVDGSTALSASIVASGVSAPPAVFLRAPSVGGLRALRAISGGTSFSAPVPDEAFHHRMLDRTRELAPLFSAVRAARPATRSTSVGSGRFTPSPSHVGIPLNAAVGDFVLLNTNADSSCTAPKNRTFRVTAVGSKSIVLADTANPKNGFADTDYARFAARFDTLVYPLDVGAFGAPADTFKTGKVAILFTKEVNALTPAGAGSFIGGFFFGRDLFPKKQANGAAVCSASNEGEMFYMLVPDPSGAVNGNARSLGFVDTLTTGVIAHEFQHLINLGQRLYGTPGANTPQATWLNEGLSHVAEELLYFRESGKGPRLRLTDADIRVNSRPTYPFWLSDAFSNFGRLVDYLEDPGGSSPLDRDDNVATRGAIWSFLRYAVDRKFTTDAGVWSRFVTATDSGLATVGTVLGSDPSAYLADWAIANYVDDLDLTTDQRFTHKSWVYHDIYNNTVGSRSGGVFTPLGYPLRTSGLGESTPVSVNVKGSSASYYRLAVPANGEALLKFSSAQGAPNASFVFTVIRTR